MIKKIHISVSLSLIISVLAIFANPFVPVAHAAVLTGLSDTMSSLKISTASTHLIKFTTPTGASDNTDTIIITFPSDFDFSSAVIGDVTFTHGATTGAETTETLAASPSGSDWGAAFSGTQNRVLTLTAPTDGVGAASVAASDKIIITFGTAAHFVNATSATSYDVAISGTFGDTGDITVTLLTDDQVSVTATVAESLTFTISDNTIGFGTLSSSAARYATGNTSGTGSDASAHDLVVGTNATNGYTMTVNGATLATGAGPTISAIGATGAASSTGTEQFGIYLVASGGTGAVSSPYDDNATPKFAFDTAAFPDEVASASGPSANTTYAVHYIANIASNTDAGAYSATLTYTATANF